MRQTTTLLEKINNPQALQRLSPEQLPELAEEIRRELLAVISANGGHLASNLGTVELTIALLTVFGKKEDRIIWDTGHQAYTYKILTGRRQLFKNLRQTDGCCGFTCPKESDFDIFGAGHAGTAISAATGIATARERQGKPGHVVAVVGDGALGCGISLEGMNNVIEVTDRLIIVLNDNKMSISPNVGALSRYLNRIISDRRYNIFKSAISRAVERIPGIGSWLHQKIHRLQEGAKGVLVDGVFFEYLGFRYIGPLNGHDINELIGTFKRLKHLDKQPLLIHVLTEKGRGYKPAEQDPATYHGLGRFDPETGELFAENNEESAKPACFGDALGEYLCRLLRQDDRIVAITAGMCDGTGLSKVRKSYPKRFFDVGIAEEHAVVFAAGMATQGARPIVAIYASFMQRAMDYVFHDVALQNLPIVFCLDRAGVVPDGPTHHGIHDLGFWQSIPNLKIMQPADSEELEKMLKLAVDLASPCVIRYPKCDITGKIPRQDPIQEIQLGQAEIIRDGSDIAIWCLGREVTTGISVAEKLSQAGFQAAVINVRFLRPFPSELLIQQAKKMPLATIEDHSLGSGLGNIAKSELVNLPEARIRSFGWPREKLTSWGEIRELRQNHGMNSKYIAEHLIRFLRRKH